MKIARFQYNGHTAHGVVDGDELVEIEGDIFSNFKAGGERRKLADVTLLAPTDPHEIWARALTSPTTWSSPPGSWAMKTPKCPNTPRRGSRPVTP